MFGLGENESYHLPRYHSGLWLAVLLKMRGSGVPENDSLDPIPAFIVAKESEDFMDLSVCVSRVYDQ